MVNFFIGYDEREIVAYHVCVNSLIQKSSEPLSISPLSLRNLQDYQELHLDGSNQFIYTRFLVPKLMNYQGWAIYVDGDMLFRSDVKGLIDYFDESKAVICVKHNYKTSQKIKYLGSKNNDYPRKNWSSVIIWNCAHPKNRILTNEKVANSSGKFLHRFEWLEDNEIGELPIEWNWLVDEFGENTNANLIHWTLGTPCFKDYKNAPMNNEWFKELEVINSHLEIE